MNEVKIKRFLEIIPGFLSWTVIIFLFFLIFFDQLKAAIILITYLLFWALRLLYMSILFMLAHHRMMKKKNFNWLKEIEKINPRAFREIYHVVLYTIYKEPKEVIIESLEALKKVNYPHKNIILVLAGEEREKGIEKKLEEIKEKFKDCFEQIVTTIHPAGIRGEIPCKGANATYAAKRVKQYLEDKKISFENVIISCFDADTRPDKNYFACLTYNFLIYPKKFQASFQPIPVYSNNFFYAPFFARIIEIGSMVWQLIESMRYEKFVTFSSHSMSFKTLIEVDYWPRDAVSDDSLIFWKCFLKFNGDYQTISLEVPVYMDIAIGKNFLDTILVQYRQKRRWAWGIENFVFLGLNFLKNKKISLFLKIRKIFQILDNHINWATWAIILTIISPLLLYLNSSTQKEALIIFNLSYLQSLIFHFLSIIFLLCIFITKEFLPSKPKEISNFFYLGFILQWIFIPFISVILSSLPSLDAQTRLMLGRYLGFEVTQKWRK